jgi:arylsulfatase A-like enzyme
MVRMRLSKFRLIAVFLALVLVSLWILPAPAQVYVGKPKLIVIVVIDQFRADQLNRHQAEFKGRGFNLFMKEGAWFTDCYYDYANTKTGPGHATIGTGAYSDGHGIDSNEWWDASRSFDQQVSSVEDEQYMLVDLPDSSIPANQPGAPSNAAKFVVGASPLNLRATTLGDELRLATQGKSRVFGVSLKDRASILPAGQSANAAYWIDPASGQFTTSTYYMEHLPAWVTAFNKGGSIEKAEKEAMVEGTTQFYDLVGHLPAANSYELDFAKALIASEKLGQNGVTDELVVSLSPHDIQGHQFGPDSDQETEMDLALDRDLDGFFNWLDQNVGLQNVWLALTADHGVAPVPGEAAKLGVHGVALDMLKVYDAVDAELNKRHSPGQKVKYLLPNPDLPYIVLDKRVFQKAGIDEEKAENELAAILPTVVAAQNRNPESVITDKPLETQPSEKRLDPGPRVQYVYTRLQLAKSELPPSEWGRLIAHSYTNHGNWFVMAVLDAYQIQGTGAFAGTTHFSPWSYDRHVPLAFYGAPFKPGEYHQLVAPVDLAVTFASLAGVNRPSAAVGRVLTEALKPAPAANAK